MTTATYDVGSSRIVVEFKAKPQTSRGFVAWLLHSFFEGRLREAEREIRRHRHLIQEDELMIAGYRIPLEKDDVLPFVR